MLPEGIVALAITVGDIENEAMELEQVERKGMNKPYFERIDYDLSMPLARQVRLPSRSVVKHHACPHPTVVCRPMLWLAPRSDAQLRSTSARYARTSASYWAAAPAPRRELLADGHVFCVPPPARCRTVQLPGTS